jgi:hypothetical protein
LLKTYYVKHPDKARQKLQILCYADHKETTQLILAMRKRRKEVLASYGELGSSKNNKDDVIFMLIEFWEKHHNEK